MNTTQKQLVAMIVVAASFASFLAGYLFIQPRNEAMVIGEQQGTILDRFGGVASDSMAEGASTDSLSPTIVPDGLTQVSADTVIAPTNDVSDDSVLYYHEQNGFVSDVNLSNHQNTQISSTALPDLINVVWSPNKKQVITVYATRTGRVDKYFNYDTHENTVLGTNIVDAVFSPDGASIALAETTGDETDIIITKPDGDSPQTILKTHFSSVSLAWPSNNTISLLVPTPDSTSSLFTVTPSGSLTQILQEEPALKINWSPDGMSFLYSTSADGQTALQIHTLAADTDTTAPIIADATNCSWYSDSASFICAGNDGGATAIQTVNIADNSTKTIADSLTVSPEMAFLSHLQDYFVMVGADHEIYAYRLP